jgi:ParB-like nuclease domain
MSETDPAALKELAEDIKKNGLRVPIVVWISREDADHPERRREPKRYSLLDGRNRLDAMELAGVKFKLKWKHEYCWWALEMPNNREDIVVKIAGYYGDPYEFVISANAHRRHLTPELKRELISKVLKAKPEKSDRQVAGIIKADHKTVGAVRSEMEGRGEIPHVKTRTDSKGRQQPAEKPRKSVPPPKPTLAVALRPHPEPAPLVEQKPLSGDAWWDQESQIIADVMVEHMTPQKITMVFDLAMDVLKTKRATAPRTLRMTETSAAATIIEATAKQPDDGLDIPDYLRREPKGGAAS